MTPHYTISAKITESRTTKMHHKNECGSESIKGYCLCCGAVVSGVDTDAIAYDRCEKKACKAIGGTVYGTMEIILLNLYGGRSMGKKCLVPAPGSFAEIFGGPDTIGFGIAPEVAVSSLTPEVPEQVETLTPEVAAILTTCPTAEDEIADARINCTEDVWEALREIEELLYA